MNGMVTTFEMQLNMFSGEMEVKKNVSKIELLFMHHPRTQLTLEFHEQPQTLPQTRSQYYDNIYQLDRFSSVTQFVKSMKFVFTSELALLLTFLEKRIPLEAPEELEITWKNLPKIIGREAITYPNEMIFPAFMDRFSNFINLTNLTINLHSECFVSSKYLFIWYKSTYIKY